MHCLGSNIHSWQEFERKNNRFVVNDYYETNIKNFYAAGNCTFSDFKIDMIITGISEATIAINRIFKLLKKKIQKYSLYLPSYWYKPHPFTFLIPEPFLGICKSFLISSNDILFSL